VSSEFREANHAGWLGTWWGFLHLNVYSANQRKLPTRNMHLYASIRSTLRPSWEEMRKSDCHWFNGLRNINTTQWNGDEHEGIGRISICEMTFESFHSELTIVR